MTELESISFNIHVEANPFPSNISVTSPNQKAKVPTILHSQNTVTIVFSAVNRYNKGTYAMVADNLVSSVSLNFTINVQCELSNYK